MAQFIYSCGIGTWGYAYNTLNTLIYLKVETTIITEIKI